MMGSPLFFFNDTATTEIYTLSLHDALPISRGHPLVVGEEAVSERRKRRGAAALEAEPGLSGDPRDLLGRDEVLVPHALFQSERSEEHTSELQSQSNLVCRLLLEKKKQLLLYSNRLVQRRRPRLHRRGPRPRQ